MCSVLIVIFIPDISNQFLISFFLDQPNLEDCRFNWYFHEMSFSLIDFFFHHLSSFYLIIAQSSLPCWAVVSSYTARPQTHTLVVSPVSARVLGHFSVT